MIQRTGWKKSKEATFHLKFQDTNLSSVITFLEFYLPLQYHGRYTNRFFYFRCISKNMFDKTQEIFYRIIFLNLITLNNVGLNMCSCCMQRTCPSNQLSPPSLCKPVSKPNCIVRVEIRILFEGFEVPQVEAGSRTKNTLYNRITKAHPA